MDEDDKGCPMIRLGVSGCVSSGTGLPGLSRTKAVKRLCVCVCVLFVIEIYAACPRSLGTLNPTLSPATGLRKTPSHVPCTLFTARRYANAVAYMLLSCVRLSVCPQSVRHKLGVLSKRLDESSWFLAWRLLYTYPKLLARKFGYFPLGLCSKLQT